MKLFYSEIGGYFWTGGTVPGYVEPVRDPSIMYYAGKYWVAHTHPVAKPPLTDFTLTSSADRITWAAPQYVSVAEICRSPEHLGAGMGQERGWQRLSRSLRHAAADRSCSEPERRPEYLLFFASTSRPPRMPP